MAHFAKVLDKKVIQVIVAEPEFFETFVDTSPGQWIQTSYNTLGGVHYDPVTKEPSNDQSKALRKNYAGVGYTYDAEHDAFIPPQPYPSWILNQESFLWECPVPLPADATTISYYWNEQDLTWEQVSE